MLSDWLFTSAVGVYMLAALLSAVEYVLGRYPARRAPVVPDRLGRMGVALTVLGALLHLFSLVLRGVASGRSRSSPGSATPRTCTRGRRPAGAPGGPRGSTSPAW